MAKRQLSEEEKDVLRARLAKARAARKTNTPTKKEDTKTVEAPAPEEVSPATEQSETVSISKEQLDYILQKIRQFEQPQAQNASGVNAFGRPVGVTVKYPTEQAYYPNPVPDLLTAPELRRYGFEDNFIVKFEVKGLDIETKWGTMYSEPEFKLTLYQRWFDENGELSDKVIKRNTAIFYEDQHAVEKFAREQGIEITDFNRRDLYDKVRIERFKRWLVDYFNPPKPDFGHKEVETVIDGQVVVMTALSEIL